MRRCNCMLTYLLCFAFIGVIFIRMNVDSSGQLNWFMFVGIEKRRHISFRIIYATAFMFNSLETWQQYAAMGRIVFGMRNSNYDEAFESGKVTILVDGTALWFVLTKENSSFLKHRCVHHRVYNSFE
jgi:hypothetical protein